MDLSCIESCINVLTLHLVNELINLIYVINYKIYSSNIYIYINNVLKVIYKIDLIRDSRKQNVLYSKLKVDNLQQNFVL